MIPILNVQETLWILLISYIILGIFCLIIWKELREVSK